MDDVLRHDHKTEEARKMYKDIWSTGYKFISDANKILEVLDEWGEGPLKRMNMYRGESIGMRAYVHFDLLRMFGAPKLNGQGIPYVTKYGMYVTPFSTTKACYEQIIADLKKAETLLLEDEKLLVYPRLPEDVYDPYASDRTAHFNLYAAKATLARVYWTRNEPGDLDSAAMYAREVIESKRFPLPADGNTITANHFIQMMAGTIAEDEGIFGLYITDTYNLFSPLFLKEKALYMPADKELYVRQDQKVDHRKEWIAIPNIADLTSEMQEKKYGNRYMKLINRAAVNSVDKDMEAIGFTGVNLIRVPEMYLILVEALLEKDPEEAKNYYNAYTTSRGMGNFEESLTTDEIDLEFRKEFLQEGQYWFRLKRRQVPEIALIPALGGTLQMDDEKWTLQIPDEEFEFRQEGSY